MKDGDLFKVKASAFNHKMTLKTKKKTISSQPRKMCNLTGRLRSCPQYTTFWTMWNQTS